MLDAGLGIINWTEVSFVEPEPIVLKATRFDSIKRIKEAVCRRYGVTIADLEGPSRKREYAMPRQIAMALSYRKLRSQGYSLPMIGRHFGGRHHTTILYACRKFGHTPDPSISSRAKRRAA